MEAALTALSGLSAWGIWALHLFGGTNGFYDLVNVVLEQRVLPGTSAKYDPSFSGLSALDSVLNGLITFFYPCSDGSNPAASLLSILFVGQAMAFCTLGTMEALRTGYRWKVPAGFTMAVLLGQFVGIGVIGPVFLAACLLTSSPLSVDKGLQAAFEDLQVLPISILVGMLGPTVLMALVGRDLFTVNQAANIIRLWQFLPVYPPVVRIILKPIARFIFPVEKSARVQRDLLVKNHAFAVACSAISHVFFWTISITALVAPGLFNPAVVSQIQPQGIFSVPLPWSGAKVASVAQGAHWFLQWDLAIISFAYLIWAFTISLDGVDDISIGEWLYKVFRSAIYTLVTGPIGAAVILIWQRDVSVLDDEVRLENKMEKLKVK